MKEFGIALKERRQIEDNKQFARLIEKTQVSVPLTGRHEVIKNRLTHSYEVATSSLEMASSIADKMGVDVFDVDYRCSLHSVSLLHDLGMIAFGHDGQAFLQDKFISLGLEEGLSDNNNNLTVIEKNGINVRDYVLVSTIKYPQKLYPSQKEKYLPMLNKALEEDAAHYKKLGINLTAQTKTIACEIMDEADRNSYTFSDMADYLCMGETLKVEDIVKTAKQFGFSSDDPMLKEFIDISQSGDKSRIKEGLSNFKYMTNQSYELTDMGLQMTNSKLELLREAINKMTMDFYIAPIREQRFHHENLRKLDAVLTEMLEGRFTPSRHYGNAIDNALSEKERLIAIRDMIAEVSDWYIINTYDELSLDNRRERRPFNEVLMTAKKIMGESKLTNEKKTEVAGFEP